MDKPRWGFLDLLLIYAGTIFLMSLLSPALNSWMNSRTFANHDLYAFLYSFFIQFCITIMLVTGVALWRKAGLKDLGIRRADFSAWVRYGLLGGVLIALFIIMAGILVEKIHPHLPQQSFEIVLRGAGSASAYFWLILVGSVFAPLSEELFYRGMVYPLCRWHLGQYWGMVLAGLLFGAAHWDLWRGIPLAIGGIFLCYVYEKSGSIMVSALTHGVWNGLLAYLIILGMGVG